MSVHDGLHPAINRLGRPAIQIGIGHTVRGQERLQPLLIQQLPVVDVVLLGRDHGQVLVLVAPVLAELDAPDHLLQRDD